MTFAGWAQLIALIVVLGVTAPLLGRYMANVYDGGPSRLDRVFGPVERLIYRACRIDPEREQRWNIYALSLLAFSVVGFFLLYVMQRIQSSLPFNPTDMANVQPALAFNTAVSFVTNTNWQSYAGESTMSHLTQMVGSHGAELRLGGRGHGGDGRADPRPRPRRAAHDRQLLGRPRPHGVPDPAADRVRVRDRVDRHGRDPEHRTGSRRCTPLPAPRRRSRAARTPARSRSRSSARTAAASSTSTPRTRSRTRPASATSSRSTRS